MSNYTKTVDFAAKDTLPSGDSGKIIKGTEFETEFDNISTAIATKADSAAPTFTGTSVFTNLDINGTVQADGAVTVGVDDTGYDVKFFGATTGKSLLWDESADSLIVTGTTTLVGTTNLDAVDVDGDMTFGDNNKAIFGDGSDLQIYHDTEHSFIKDAGTGHLKIQAINLKLQDVDGNNYIDCIDGSYVRLMHNANTKLETTATGIDVTGDIVLGDSNPTITFEDGSITNLSHTVSSASDNLRLTVDVNGVDAGSRVEIFDGSTEVARFSAGAMDVTGSVTADGLTVDGVGEIELNDTTVYSGSAASVGQLNLKNFDTTTAYTPAVLGFTARGTTTTSSVWQMGNAGLNSAYAESDFFIKNRTAASTYAQRFLIEGNGDVSFYEDTGTTPKLVWKSADERLGIGTSSPSAKLDSQETYDTVTNILTNGTYAAKFGGDTGVGAAGRAQGIMISGRNGTARGAAILAENQNSGNAHDLLFATSTNASAPAERMRIDSSGNVGIGCTPSYPLEVQSGGVGTVLRAGTSFVSIDSVGSESSPSLILNGDSNTGFWHPASDTLAVSTAGTEAMRLDASGALVLNNSGGDAQMYFGGTSGTTRMYLARSGSDSLLWNVSNGVMRFGTNNAERMRIDSSGNVGIGGTPTAPLHVFGGGILGASSTNPIAFTGSGGTNAGIGSYTANSDFNVYSAGTGDIKFVTGAVWSSAGVLTTVGSERMRIDSSGNLLVGTTSTAVSSSTGSVTGTVINNTGLFEAAKTGTVMELNRLTDDGTILNFRKDGTTVGSISVTASATAYNTSSDQRLKENIADADDAGSKIDAIQVRKFDWKADGSHQDYGMVAQELQSVAPEAVSGEQTQKK